MNKVLGSYIKKIEKALLFFFLKKIVTQHKKLFSKIVYAEDKYYAIFQNSNNMVREILGFYICSAPSPIHQLTILYAIYSIISNKNRWTIIILVYISKMCIEKQTELLL